MLIEACLCYPNQPRRLSVDSPLKFVKVYPIRLVYIRLYASHI